MAYDTFQSGVLCPGTYTEVFNSNALEYGGTGVVNPEPIEAVKESWDFKDYSIKYHLGAYGVCIFKFDYVEPEPEPKISIILPAITRKSNNTGILYVPVL